MLTSAETKLAPPVQSSLRLDIDEDWKLQPQELKSISASLLRDIFVHLADYRLAWFNKERTRQAQDTKLLFRSQ